MISITDEQGIEGIDLSEYTDGIDQITDAFPSGGFCPTVGPVLQGWPCSRGVPQWLLHHRVVSK